MHMCKPALQQKFLTRKQSIPLLFTFSICLIGKACNDGNTQKHPKALLESLADGIIRSYSISED